MTRHSTNKKLTKAAKDLRNPSKSASEKSKAAKVLKKHQDKKH